MQTAVCPLCGQQMQVEEQAVDNLICPNCDGALRARLNGKAVVLDKAPKPVKADSVEVQRLLAQAKQTDDPVKRYELLLKARNEAPDSFEVHKALLYHGRLHERSPKRLDFSVIKCYLIHPMEQPGAHSDEETKAYCHELFESELLKRCMELAADDEAFYHEYLQDICRQYIDMFLRGSSQHMRSIFGFKTGKAEKLLAYPGAGILHNILESGYLTPQQRQDLYNAFYQAYRADVGDTSFLDSQL